MGSRFQIQKVIKVLDQALYIEKLQQNSINRQLSRLNYIGTKIESSL